MTTKVSKSPAPSVGGKKRRFKYINDAALDGISGGAQGAPVADDSKRKRDGALDLNIAAGDAMSLGPDFDLNFQSPPTPPAQPTAHADDPQNANAADADHKHATTYHPDINVVPNAEEWMLWKKKGTPPATPPATDDHPAAQDHPASDDHPATEPSNTPPAPTGEQVNPPADPHDAHGTDGHTTDPHPTPAPDTHTATDPAGTPTAPVAEHGEPPAQPSADPHTPPTDTPSTPVTEHSPTPSQPGADTHGSHGTEDHSTDPHEPHDAPSGYVPSSGPPTRGDTSPTQPPVVAPADPHSPHEPVTPAAVHETPAPEVPPAPVTPSATPEEAHAAPVDITPAQPVLPLDENTPTDKRWRYHQCYDNDPKNVPWPEPLPEGTHLGGASDDVLSTMWRAEVRHGVRADSLDEQRTKIKGSDSEQVDHRPPQLVMLDEWQRLNDMHAKLQHYEDSERRGREETNTKNIDTRKGPIHPDDVGFGEPKKAPSSDHSENPPRQPDALDTFRQAKQDYENTYHQKRRTDVAQDRADRYRSGLPEQDRPSDPLSSPVDDLRGKSDAQSEDHYAELNLNFHRALQLYNLTVDEKGNIVPQETRPTSSVTDHSAFQPAVTPDPHHEIASQDSGQAHRTSHPSVPSKPSTPEEKSPAQVADESHSGKEAVAHTPPSIPPATDDAHAKPGAHAPTVTPADDGTTPLVKSKRNIFERGAHKITKRMTEFADRLSGKEDAATPPSANDGHTGGTTPATTENKPHLTDAQLNYLQDRLRTYQSDVVRSPGLALDPEYGQDIRRLQAAMNRLGLTTDARGNLVEIRTDHTGPSKTDPSGSAGIHESEPIVFQPDAASLTWMRRNQVFPMTDESKIGWPERAPAGTDLHGVDENALISIWRTQAMAGVIKAPTGEVGPAHLALLPILQRLNSQVHDRDVALHDDPLKIHDPAFKIASDNLDADLRAYGLVKGPDGLLVLDNKPPAVQQEIHGDSTHSGPAIADTHAQNTHPEVSDHHPLTEPTHEQETLRDGNTDPHAKVQGVDHVLTQPGQVEPMDDHAHDSGKGSPTTSTDETARQLRKDISEEMDKHADPAHDDEPVHFTDDDSDHVRDHLLHDNSPPATPSDAHEEPVNFTDEDSKHVVDHLLQDNSGPAKPSDQHAPTVPAHELDPDHPDFKPLPPSEPPPEQPARIFAPVPKPGPSVAPGPNGEVPPSITSGDSPPVGPTPDEPATPGPAVVPPTPSEPTPAAEHTAPASDHGATGAEHNGQHATPDEHTLDDDTHHITDEEAADAKKGANQAAVDKAYGLLDQRQSTVRSGDKIGHVNSGMPDGEDAGGHAVAGTNTTHNVMVNAAGVTARTDALAQAEAGYTYKTGPVSVEVDAKADARGSGEVHIGKGGIDVKGQAAAEASASVGASVSGNLGHGVQGTVGVEDTAEVHAQAGARIGTQGVDAAVAVGATNTTSVGAGIKADLGKGVSMANEVHAGVVETATAVGHAGFSKDGIGMAQGAVAGQYESLGASITVGNDHYSGTAGGDIHGPGAVGFNEDASANFSDGKVKLNISGDLDIGLVGFNFHLGGSVDVGGVEHSAESALSSAASHVGGCAAVVWHEVEHATETAYHTVADGVENAADAVVKWFGKW